jgi:hypothetical protein
MDDRRVLWPRNRHRVVCIRDKEGTVSRSRISAVSLLLVVFDVMDRWVGGSVRFGGRSYALYGRVLITFRVDHVFLCITRSNLLFRVRDQRSEIKGSRETVDVCGQDVGDDSTPTRRSLIKRQQTRLILSNTSSSSRND